MSIGRALAMLGAGLGGYAQGRSMANEEERKAAEEERRKADAAWQEKVRAQQQKQWDLADQERAAVQEAAATRVVDDSMIPQQIGSRDEPSVSDAGIRVVPEGQVGTPVAGAQTFATQDEAAKAAAEANKLSNRMGRVASSLAALNPERAAKINADNTQAQLHDIQLQEATQKQTDEAWNRDFGEKVPFGDWNAAAKFATETTGDKNGGKSKFSFDLSPDGTKMVLSKSEDGKNWKPVADFDNNAVGFMKMVTGAMRMPTSEKAKHLMEISKDEVSREQWRQTYELQKAAEERRGLHEKRMEEIALKQLEVARGHLGLAQSKAKDILDGMTKGDQMLFKMHAATVEANEKAIAKARAEGSDIKPDALSAMKVEMANAQAAMFRILKSYEKGSEGKNAGGSDVLERGGAGAKKPPAAAPAPAKGPMKEVVAAPGQIPGQATEVVAPPAAAAPQPGGINWVNPNAPGYGSMARQAAAGNMAAQQAAATQAFNAIDPKDPTTAQALQDSPLFGYLTPQQQQQVQAVVMGR